MELSGGPVFGVRFIGEKGTLTLERGGFRSDPASLTAEPLEDPKVEIPHSTNHHQDWLNCIRQRREPVANAEVGQRSTTVAHLGNIARWVSEVTGETGQKLRWDAKQERFTNSPEGNQFLHRRERKEYALPDRV